MPCPWPGSNSRFCSALLLAPAQECCSRTPLAACPIDRASVCMPLQGMTPRQISMLAQAGGAEKQASPQGDEDVCGSAGNMTTVRAIDAPYMYSSRTRRRELRKQADRWVPFTCSRK